MSDVNLNKFLCSDSYIIFTFVWQFYLTDNYDFCKINCLIKYIYHGAFSSGKRFSNVNIKYIPPSMQRGHVIFSYSIHIQKIFSVNYNANREVPYFFAHMFCYDSNRKIYRNIIYIANLNFLSYN